MSGVVKSPEPPEQPASGQDPAGSGRRCRRREEGGVEAFTTRAIAERVGISAPSLYRFFADRDRVLDALMEQHLERLRAVAARWLIDMDAAGANQEHLIPIEDRWRTAMIRQ
ncbi:TetR/AcrR family transcriptional regulator [Streptomyces sp. NBC_01717]|uniref:TetR/AcrR family transcriptional regulator n=1 Tax=Streptomyces sp. NBC_01717 TaxID=2975918 RepID=UPI002E33E3E6|nr:helix-turn-helix domain-containing protein [Streptomyces sp. NBC_01717]